MKFLAVFLLVLKVSSLEAYIDHVVTVGNGSGVILNSNIAVTARHVIGQMSSRVGRNSSAECFDSKRPFIGNYDNYKLGFVPEANNYDLKSLKNGQINFRKLSRYNDWAAIEMTYINMGSSLRIDSPYNLNRGSRLLAVGHLSHQKYVNDSIKFLSTDGKTILFSYDSGSSFGRGFSGGGLFKSNGTLIGIIFAMNENDNTGAATSVEYIESELRSSCNL